MRTYEGYRRWKGAWQPSAAERRVLDELASGQTNAEIGQGLGLSTETVKWHLSQLLAETGCADRQALAEWWQQRTARRPLFVPLLGWSGRAAATVAAFGLAALLLLGLATARSQLNAARERHSLAATVPTPTELPSSRPAGLPTPLPIGPRAPVDVVWVATGSPPMGYALDVALDADGYVYVAERDGASIRKFDRIGHQIGRWGSAGTGDGQFIRPEGSSDMPIALVVDGRGRVLVADATGRVQIFARDGTFLGIWPVAGGGSGPLTSPGSMALAPDGAIYATNFRPPAVYKFTPDGELLARWGSGGSGDGEFAASGGAGGVTVGPDGTVYVADRDQNRIQAFDPDGRFRFVWGQFGSGDGELNRPLGLGSDRDGNVYVADNQNSRVQKFDALGRYLAQGGQFGTQDGEFVNPGNVKIDDQGFLYISDLGGDRLQKIRLR